LCGGGGIKGKLRYVPFLVVAIFAVALSGCIRIFEGYEKDCGGWIENAEVPLDPKIIGIS